MVIFDGVVKCFTVGTQECAVLDISLIIRRKLFERIQSIQRNGWPVHRESMNAFYLAGPNFDPIKKVFKTPDGDISVLNVRVGCVFLKR